MGASAESDVCKRCGACCAAFRVDFAADELLSRGGTVPDGLSVEVNGSTCRMRGTDHVPVRCAALKGEIGQRINGVMISMVSGKALGYALFNLQDRGRMFIDHGTEVYEGMIIGIHSRDNDLVVNPTKAKQLTNIRAAGSDENILLTPPIRMSLEQALEFIDDDELVEVTPKSIRLRKKLLLEHERKKASRSTAEA